MLINLRRKSGLHLGLHLVTLTQNDKILNVAPHTGLVKHYTLRKQD